jgi:hypothetical protein
MTIMTSILQIDYLFAVINECYSYIDSRIQTLFFEFVGFCAL